MVRRGGTAILCALFASGCSIHPLPEDLTGVPTVQIVRQIRCEAQASLRNIIIDDLGRIQDAYVQSVVWKFREDPNSIVKMDGSVFKGRDDELSDILDIFSKTGVAYNFDFDITEDNNVGALVDILKPVSHNIFTSSFGFSANRKRESHRSFTVSDTFQSLLALPGRYCSGQSVDENFAYPLVGKIGIEGLLRDFIALTLFGGLSASQPMSGSSGSDKSGSQQGAVALKMPSGAAKTVTARATSNTTSKPKLSGPPTMADALTFTTTISAAITPKITFTPGSRGWQVADTSVPGVADRTDAHKVTLGVAIATDDVVNIDPLRLQLQAGVAGTLVIGRRVTGGGTASEQLAVVAIDQFKQDRVNLVNN